MHKQIWDEKQKKKIWWNIFVQSVEQKLLWKKENEYHHYIVKIV